MQRMSRAGRIQQIKARMWAVGKRTGKKQFTAGEISKLVGLKSSTWFKSILTDMCREGELIAVYDFMAGYTDAIPHYSVPTFVQLALPERWIIVNGQTVRMS